MNIWFKLAAGLIIALAAFSGGVAASRNHYLVVISTMKEKQATEARLAAEQRSKLISDNQTLSNALEVEHANANAAINTILDSPVPRVRLKFLPATDCVQAQAPGGVPAAVAISGVLPEQIESILDADRQRTRGIVAEAERELAECRVSKTWAAAQN